MFGSCSFLLRKNYLWGLGGGRESMVSLDFPFPSRAHWWGRGRGSPAVTGSLALVELGGGPREEREYKY